ncbi:MAG: transcriptional regulator [Alphaproteobacteria bacterium]|nr:transcriptional regulator [Alphaproteobacteria bacterium]
MTRTVHIGVSSTENVKARTKAAFKGKAQGERISFASVDMMHRVLTPNRWGVLRALMGHDGMMSVRELARILDRDVKGVHNDIVALALAGIIEHNADGSVAFPYDAVHVEFTVEAA